MRDEWRDHAACAEMEEEIFYLPENESRAKAICAGCPVRIECLDDAFYYKDIDPTTVIPGDETPGIRGGLNWSEQLTVLRHRNRYDPHLRLDVSEL